MEISIQKWGNSYGIRIPKSTMLKLNLKEKQALILNDSNNQILLSKSVHMSLAERMKGFTDEFVCDEVYPNDKPVGKEVW